MCCAMRWSNSGSRIETRVSTVSTDIDWLKKNHTWPGLEAIGIIARIRETSTKTSTETACYLLNTPISAKHIRTSCPVILWDRELPTLDA
jgi:hypothetical protein